MGSNSLNGLKFGQKIYFEDDSGEKLVSGSKKNGQNGSNPPRCQVEGCNVDLSDAKAYYSRHKVCGMHSKSPLVVVNGLEQRFCQQCSRFVAYQIVACILNSFLNIYTKGIILCIYKDVMED